MGTRTRSSASPAASDPDPAAGSAAGHAGKTAPRTLPVSAAAAIVASPGRQVDVMPAADPPVRLGVSGAGLRAGWMWWGGNNEEVIDPQTARTGAQQDDAGESSEM